MSTTQGHHARHRLDEAIHAPVRLSLVAALAQVDEAEFAHVRDTIEVTDSTLSKQAAQLEVVGYVRIRKGHVGKRPRTWLSLTPTGREALARHLDALRLIAEGPSS
ncbi:transcriptional regulator [uncultured Pseudokineococcus sp.]|uniref:winged helix-turn-helix domain-containing protein n=1 Tax=uncultured Pseudokineococcus sp. TaxID=1642928 RepID=UPI00261FA4FB|nr:transcriptional regulator [uncultured Pseudokineococcus sp.]